MSGDAERPKVFPRVLASATPAASSVGGVFVPLHADPDGNLWTHLAVDDGAGGFVALRARAPGATVAETAPRGLDANAYLYAFDENTGAFQRLVTSDTSDDGWDALQLGLLGVIARQMVFNGTSFDRVRTPNVFNTATATATGNTAVWVPAAGKRFRLMGYQLEVSGDATLAVLGVLTAQFQDAAAAMGVAHSPFVPAAALNTHGALYQTPWVLLGNGFLSAAIDQTLNINLSVALTAGTVRVNVAGTEE